jgi:uncharacterized protein YceK
MKKLCTSIFAVCLLAGCSTVKIHSWADPEIESRKIGKTMVLGVAESDSLCREYEILFVDSLTEVGVDAHSFHALLQKADPVTEEVFAAALQENGYDSIIVTRKLSEVDRQQAVPVGYYPSYYGNYYGYYSHAFSLSYDTAYVQSFMEFELETNLYDVKTKKLVWTGRCTVYDDRTDRTNMKGVIKGIIKDLGEKGLL